MRTTGYAYLLVVQVVVLCVVLTVGPRIVRDRLHPVVPTSGTTVQQQPVDRGFGGLRDYLAR